MHILSHLVVGLAVMGLAVMATPSSVLAAASNSVGVNPRRDYTVKPGENFQDTLNVSNLSQTEDLYITIRTIDFSSKNETGDPALMLKETRPTKWSLKPYLKIPTTLTIAAGKSVSVPFSIEIPKNVGAGSYYSAIQYSTNGSAPSGGNVNLTSSAATLMFVRVPGEANEILRLKQFGAFTPYDNNQGGTFASFYGGSAPKYLAFRLENKGNVAGQPGGSVILKNIFGKQVKIFEKANPNNNIVLIGQTRRFDLCINEDRSSHKDTASGRNVETVKCNESSLAPGRYTAQLALVYGDNGSTSHELGAVASFWYLPIWFVVISLAVLAAIAALVWYIIRKITQRSRPAFSSRR